MDNYIEALIRTWRDKIAHEQIICRFVKPILMFIGLVTLSQPALADRVRNIQNMKLVSNISLSDQ